MGRFLGLQGTSEYIVRGVPYHSLTPAQSVPLRSDGLEQHPCAVLVAVVLIEAQHRLGLLLVNLVMDEEVDLDIRSPSITLKDRASWLRSTIFPTHQPTTGHL